MGHGVVSCKYTKFDASDFISKFLRTDFVQTDKQRIETNRVQSNERNINKEEMHIEMYRQFINEIT